MLPCHKCSTDMVYACSHEFADDPPPCALLKIPQSDEVVDYLKKLWGDTHITTEVTQAVEETIEYIDRARNKAATSPHQL